MFYFHIWWNVSLSCVCIVYGLLLLFLVKSRISSLCLFCLRNFLLIVDGMLKHYCDIIAAPIRFDFVRIIRYNCVNASRSHKFKDLVCRLWSSAKWLVVKKTGVSTVVGLKFFKTNILLK